MADVSSGPNGVEKAMKPNDKQAEDVDETHSVDTQHRTESSNGKTNLFLDGEERKQTKCRCAILNLSVDKFVIDQVISTKNQSRVTIPKGKGSGKHSFVSSSSSSALHAAGTKQLNSGLPKIALGTLGEIRSSAKLHNCAFCKLLVGAVEHYNLPSVNTGSSLNDDNIPIQASWEIDGHRHNKRTKQVQNVSRRLSLSWTHRDIKRDAYFVYVAPQNPNLPNSDANSGFHNKDSFLARTVEPNKGKQALIRSWIDLCDQGHGEDCSRDKDYKEAFVDLMGQTYFGVIDVVDLQLKKLPLDEDGEPEKFVALSYVWEQGPTYTTTKSNVSIHLQHGGLESVLHKFPRVIRDAISLVQRLGLRYLWVDRLCIVQDSMRSWRLNAAAMNLVYGQAYLTICAADGNDAHSGFLGMQTGSPSNQLVAKVAPGLKLLVSRSPENVIQESKWNRRGWTFQERLLSSRCVIFAEGKVYFQCRTTGFSEDIHSDANSSAWGLDSTNSPLQSFNLLEKKSIWFYMMCVSLYSRRELTRAGDIIAAFDGMSNVMEKTMQAPFCFGLPTSHFDFALLWQPKGKLVRRIEPKDNDFRGAEFPSWSWVGFEGSSCQYDTKELEGCLLNVEEWLLNHTWIKWYIRDENGNLRPLWDIEVSKSDSSTEKRWKGYTGISKDSEFKTPYGNGILGKPRQGLREPSGLALEQYGASWDAEFDFIRQEKEYESYGPENSADYPRRYREEERQKRMMQEEKKRAMEEEKKRYEIALREEKRKRKKEEEEAKARWERQRREGQYANQNYVPDSGEDMNYRESPGRADYRSSPRRPPPRTSERYGARDIVLRKKHEYPPPPIRILRDESRTRRERLHGRSPSASSSASSLSTFSKSCGNDEKWQEIDSYGRSIRAELADKPYDRFKSIISEYPFGNRPPLARPACSTQLTDVPILQFFTWRKPLSVISGDDSDLGIKHSGMDGLSRCAIADGSGDWCGSIVLNSSFINSRSGQEFQFIAISEAKAFTMDECPQWTYYVAQEREESEWDLYFVLLIKRNSEKLIWERVGLGKVFKMAFSGATWDEIKLG